MSDSDQKSCVKGGVFFPIPDSHFLATRVARKWFQPFWQIQGALAYYC